MASKRDARALVPDPLRMCRARQLASCLAEEWAEAPYFRSAEGVSYTPRRQLRGFLEHPQHPLGEALLLHLFALAALSDPGELPALMRSSQEALRERSGRLAQALRHLFGEHRTSWEELTRHRDHAQWRRRILDGAEPSEDRGLRGGFRAWRDEEFGAGD